MVIPVILSLAAVIAFLALWLIFSRHRKTFTQEQVAAMESFFHSRGQWKKLDKNTWYKHPYTIRRLKNNKYTLNDGNGIVYEFSKR
jgi:hypothetical protein